MTGACGAAGGCVCACGADRSGALSLSVGWGPRQRWGHPEVGCVWVCCSCGRTRSMACASLGRWGTWHRDALKQYAGCAPRPALGLGLSWRLWPWRTSRSPRGPRQRVGGFGPTSACPAFGGGLPRTSSCVASWVPGLAPCSRFGMHATLITELLGGARHPAARWWWRRAAAMGGIRGGRSSSPSCCRQHDAYPEQHATQQSPRAEWGMLGSRGVGLGCAGRGQQADHASRDYATAATPATWGEVEAHPAIQVMSGSALLVIWVWASTSLCVAAVRGPVMRSEAPILWLLGGSRPGSAPSPEGGERRAAVV